MIIRVLIVDDESPARKRIADLLKDCEEVVVIGEARDGFEAVEKVKELQPDLIFLDIQMPGSNGLSVVGKLIKPPLIVFVTAFQNYALDAFDLSAFDYLLKPFTNERFHSTIEKARAFFNMKEQAELSGKIKNLLEEKEHNKKNLHLIVNDSGIDRKIKFNDIHHIKSDGNYVRIYHDDTFSMYRMPIQYVEDLLPGDVFIRIHRGSLVNLSRVKKIIKGEQRELIFHLINTETVKSGRSYRKIILEFLSTHTEFAALYR